MNYRTRERFKYGAIYLALTLFVLLTLTPYFWLIVTSFKSRVDAFAIPPKIIFEPIWNNYKEAFIDKAFLSNLKNSVIVTGFSTFLALVIGLPSAYAFSRFPVKGDKVLFYYLLGTRFTPIVVLCLPLYIIMSKIGLLDSYPGIIIAHVTFNLPFVVWMMKGFFDVIPREVDEAAIVDGCSWFFVFTRMALPIARSGLAATAVFCAANSWNEFLMALILTEAYSDNACRCTRTMTTGNIMGDSGRRAVITVPVLIFASTVQKHMVKGMTMGN